MLSIEVDLPNFEQVYDFHDSLQVSVEHTDYIQKERTTRAAPPKPALNPMQFVAIKPSVLQQTAVEQLKKAEEIRKATAKEVSRKEEPEDWQNVSF
jgi:F-box protein 20